MLFHFPLQQYRAKCLQHYACLDQNTAQPPSSVARGGHEPPPIGLWSMQNRTFLVVLSLIFGEKLKIAPHRKTAPLKQLDFRVGPNNQSQNRRRPFFFFGDLILGDKKRWIWDFGRKFSLKIDEDLFFWRPPDFGWKKPLNFRGFREISSQFLCKPCETDSRAMKIWVKVVCTLLTLSK